MLCFWFMQQDQEIPTRSADIDGGEILDEMITRSRGEIRHTHSPKVTSSTPNLTEDIKPAFSPRMSPRAFSPKSTGKGVMEKQTHSPGPSTLGKNTYGSSSN